MYKKVEKRLLFYYYFGLPQQNVYFLLDALKTPVCISPKKFFIVFVDLDRKIRREGVVTRNVIFMSPYLFIFYSVTLRMVLIVEWRQYVVCKAERQEM